MLTIRFHENNIIDYCDHKSESSLAYKPWAFNCVITTLASILVQTKRSSERARYAQKVLLVIQIVLVLSSFT